MGQLVKTSERKERFISYDHEAARCFESSRMDFIKGFLYLDNIREESLYTEGGYEDWEGYLSDFIDHNGMSRSLAMRNLQVIRMAKRCGWNYEDIVTYGLYSIRPYFETGRDGIILDYNRRTGEIVDLPQPVMNEVRGNGDLSLAYGKYVKESVNPGDPASVSRQAIRQLVMNREITFFPVMSDGSVVDIEWYVEGQNEQRHGYLRTMTDEVKGELIRRINRR